MNKLVREIAAQAHDLAVFASEKGEHLCAVGSDYFLTLKQEIFAELIIRKCAQVGEDTGGDWRVSSEILKEFGLK